MSIKGAIFDMDGVVVDNHRYHFQAWMEFAKKHKFELNDQIYRDTFNGKTNADLFAMIFGKLTKEKEHELALEKETLYQELYYPHMEVLKGLYQFLEHLKRKKIKIALGTSAPPMNVDFVLDKLLLRSSFGVIVDGTMVKKGKPDPEVYQLCASKLGLAPHECVVFEDSLAGLESGSRAGCEVVGVATSHRPWELRSSAPDIILDFTDPVRQFR